MSFKYGKYTKITPRKPKAVGTCDYTGFLVRHRDLIQQMEYRGNGLAWTGYWVYKDFADKPNPQNQAKVIKPDPVPIRNARPEGPIRYIRPPEIPPYLR